jgi:hypothetical protein
MSFSAFAEPKFNYGDIVEVYSSSWKKPCINDEFVNVCGKNGIVIDLGSNHGCVLYTVKFIFRNIPDITKTYCEEHLRKVKQ